MAGMLIGVGVGPGDPRMMTLGAAQRLRDADVVCLPQASKQACRSYRVAAQAVPEVADKPCLCLDFGMTRDSDELQRIHREAYRRVRDECLAGQCVAFLTLGDPSVYSTFCYLAGRARAEGLPVEVEPGVTSFCAVAARAVVSLCEGDEQLHVGTAANAEELLGLVGTRVIMKCGRRMGEVRAALRVLEDGGDAEVVAVTECGTPREQVWYGADAIPDEVGYMTTVIVREATPEA